MDDDELGGGQWPNVAMPTQGVVIQTHESLLNNAADRNKYFLGRVEGKRELSHKGENFGRTGSLNSSGDA